MSAIKIGSIVQVFFSDFLSKAFIGAMGILLIRFMSEAEYAHYILALSLVAVVTQTFSTSFNRIYIVGYQRLNLEYSPSSFLGIQLWGISALVVLTLPFISYLKGNYWFILALIIATCLSEFSKTFYQRKLKFFFFSMIEIARGLVFSCSLLLLIYIVRHDLKSWQVLFTQAITLFAVFILAFHKHLRLSKLLDVTEGTRFAMGIVKGEYKYLFGYHFILAFFSQVDVFMLKSMTSEIELATYGSAFRYYSLLLLALSAVHVIILPSIQQIKNFTELESIFKKHKTMLLLFGPLVLIGAWASQWIIPWIDMGKYPDAVIVFRILSLSSIISFAFSPHINLVLRFEDFKFLFLLIGMTLVLNVGLNMALIPILGVIGVAIATLIAFGCVNGSIFLRARKHKQKFAITSKSISRWHRIDDEVV